MAAWQAVGDKWRQWFGPLFIETSYVARIYGDSLRDNFVGYTPTDVQKLGLLQAEFDAIMAKKRPYLADLLKVEVALLETMPDDVMRARFWAVRDRFNRVVPAGTRARYEAGTPPADNKRCQAYGDRMARSLSLLNAESFFKMLILAFLAGFAERLVPDILSRLSKRAS